MLGYGIGYVLLIFLVFRYFKLHLTNDTGNVFFMRNPYVNFNL